MASALSAPLRHWPFSDLRWFPSAQAQSTWLGTTSTSWGDSSNWSAGVPISGGIATFNGLGNGNVAIDLGGAIQPIGTILFDTASAGAYTFSGNAGDAFRFDSGGAITINAGVTTNQIFNSQLRFLGLITATNNGTGLLTLNGGTALGTGGTAGLFTVTGTGNTVINGVIAAGSISGLTKTGTGQLTLSALNTYTGTTTISAGSILLTNATGLQSSTVANGVANGLIFDSSVSGNAFTLGGLSGAGALALQNNAGTPAAVALTVGGNNAGTTYSGVLSGPGTLTKVGTGTLTLSSNASSFTGNLVINAGTLATGTNVGTNSVTTALGAATTPTRTITINSGATMNWTVNNVFGGGGGTATNRPTIVVNGGTFSSTRYNMIGNLVLNGGTLVQSASDGTAGGGSAYQGYNFIGDVTVGGTSPSLISTTNGKGDHLLGTGTANINFNVADVTGDANTDLNVTAPILNGSGDYGNNNASALTKNGAGTMRLSVGNTNSNAYSGPTNVNGGAFLGRAHGHHRGAR